jgi:predicted enzyme related to lactoylglutathione lyase
LAGGPFLTSSAGRAFRRQRHLRRRRRASGLTQHAVFTQQEDLVLTSASVTANIPAADLARARTFYADTLGLNPATEVADAGMLIYRTKGGTEFSVYQTEYAGQAGHTIAQFHVDDVVAEARALQANGVALETYDMPGVEWDDGIADMGPMGKAAWFKDSEGNILCIDSGFPDG